MPAGNFLDIERSCSGSRTGRRLGCCLALLLAIMPSWPGLTRTALAQQQDAAAAAVDELTPDQRLIWNREWSLYASKYTQIGDEYFACPKYHPGLPSSLGKTAQQLVEESTRTRQVRVGGTMVKDVIARPNLQDAREAAQALPSLVFGEYGHVHSVQIVQVRGPQEMIVRDVWLIDAEELEKDISRLKQRAGDRHENQVEGRFHFRMQLADHQRSQDGFGRQGIQLIGYDTQGLRPDTRWRGPQGQGLDIAIAGPRTISYTRQGSARPRELQVVVALPVTELRGRLSREQFISMLATRNLTLKQFIELSVQKKKEDPATALQATLEQVESQRPTPEIEPEVSEADQDRQQRRLEREQRQKERQQRNQERKEKRKARQAQREADREKDAKARDADD